MGLDFVPRLLGLFEFLALSLANLLAVLDGLFDAGNIGAERIEASLDFVETVRQLGVFGAPFFEGGFHSPQLRHSRFERRLLLLYTPPLAGAFLVQHLVTQGQQLGPDPAFLLTQLLETFCTARLPLQLIKLFINFFS